MVDHLREAIARGAGGEALPLSDGVRYRRDYAFAASLAVRAVTRLFETSGDHALYREVPIQRHFRDVHAGSHQVAIVWDTAAQSSGRVQVGLQPGGQIF